MTKRQPPRPDGLNSKGNGKGLKVVTRPVTKKRGASVDRTAPVANNRAKYRSASCIPVAELATTINPDKPLTEKAKLFVKFWAQGESVQSAAVKAGYGDGASYAYRLVHFPQAIALYNKEKAAYEAAAQMTRKKVMDGLLEGIEMAKLVSEPSTMISGWREIGKLCGYYEPTRQRIDISVNGSVQMQHLNRLNDAELLQIIQQSAQQDLNLLSSGELGDEEPEG
jgi:hypothetical protein